MFSSHDGTPRGGVAIGDSILDVGAALEAGLLSGTARDAAEAAMGPVLNPLLALPANARSALRRRLSEILAADSDARGMASQLLHDAAACTLHLPATVGDYTDFFAGIHHARKGGQISRPDNPLMPNYKHVPVAYHSRASSVRPSGEDVRGPHGQHKLPIEPAPTFGPCRNLDYELELGVWIGAGNRQDEPIPIGEASERIAGFCLLNDWSARDIQSWESQPLGPFLGKSFRTSVLPWIVTAEAMEPFRIAQPARPAGDPRPLPLRCGRSGTRRIRHRLRGVSVHAGDTRHWRRAASSVPFQYPRALLDGGADGGAPFFERLQSAARRSVRQRHHFRHRRDRNRLSAGNDLWRARRDHADQR